MSNLKVGAWDCPSCGRKKIWGYIRHCPSCGTACGDDIKYYLPEDAPDVDDVPEITEVIPEYEDWRCAYCGSYNRHYTNTCSNCGADKSEGSNYFNKQSKQSVSTPSYDYVEEDINNNETPSATSDIIKKTNDTYKDSENTNNRTAFINNICSFCKSIGETVNWKVVVITGAILFVIATLLFMFLPREKELMVNNFSWERVCYIDEYKTVNENDWYLPSNARLRYTKEEIHHYDQVLDGYKTETYTVQEQDGYETKTRTVDKGNGYFETETYSVPKYKTVTKTREVPVYKDVPVFKTKYYYEIDKWVFKESIISTGNDKEPYWASNLPKNVESPKIGDVRIGNTSEKYQIAATIVGNDKVINYTVGYDEWSNLNSGDVIICTTNLFNNIYEIKEIKI